MVKSHIGLRLGLSTENLSSI